MQERFNRWLSYLSNTVESWTQFKLGIFLAEQGDLNAAVESYNKAVHLTPNYPDIHYRLGNALLEQREHNAAIESYKAAIKLRSNFPEAHNNLGVVLQEKGNLDSAISSYKTYACCIEIPRQRGEEYIKKIHHLTTSQYNR